MKKLFVKIKGVLCGLIWQGWIVSPVGENCRPVPVYIVMEDK